MRDALLFKYGLFIHQLLGININFDKKFNVYLYELINSKRPF